MKMCEQILKKHSLKNSGNDSKEKLTPLTDMNIILLNDHNN